MQLLEKKNSYLIRNRHKINMSQNLQNHFVFVKYIYYILSFDKYGFNNHI